MKKSIVIDFLFLILLVTNLFFVLFPNLDSGLIKTSFTNNEQFIDFYSINLLIFNFVLFCIILLCTHTFELNKIFYLLILLEFFYFISSLLGGFNNAKFGIIANPISYLTIFCVLFRYNIHKNIASLIFILLLIWTIIPVFILLFAPFELKLKVFTDGSFSGFATNRNQFGFFAGITTILLFFVKLKTKWRIILFLFIFFEILMSESRTTIIAIIIFPTYYFFIRSTKNKVSKYLILFCSILLLLGIYFLLENYSLRKDYLTSNDDRNGLLIEYINIFKNNILFGTGGPLVSEDKIPSHNFIIEILASYGIFTGATFFVFIYFVWEKGSIYFKALWLYLLFFGLFQPYFRFVTINNMTLILLLTAISFNKKEYEPISIFPNIFKPKSSNLKNDISTIH